MIEPTEQDIGRKVVYIPSHAHPGHPDCEEGVLTGTGKILDHSHVRYPNSPSAKLTPNARLEWACETKPDKGGDAT